MTGECVVLDQHDVGLLARLQAARRSSRPSACAPPRVAQSTTCSARSERVGDGVALHVGLEVLARAVGAERGPHRGEQVAAPPHAGVHRQRHRDVVLRAAARWAGSPGRRSARSRWTPRPSRRWPRSGGRSRRTAWPRARRSFSGVMKPFSCISRMPSSLVAPHTPGVRGDRHAQLAGHLERGLLRERRVAGDVEGHLEAEHVVARRRTGARRSRGTSGVGRPLPRALPGCCRRPARTGRAPPPARRPRPRAWSTVCSPCDQSTVVVTPGVERLERGQQVARRRRPAAGTTCPTRR